MQQAGAGPLSNLSFLLQNKAVIINGATEASVQLLGPDSVAGVRTAESALGHLGFYAD
jgi:hypothetical protein